MKKFPIRIMVIVTLLMSLAVGCSSLDVVGKDALTSFEAFAKAPGNKFTLETAEQAWVLHSPNDEHFIMTLDSALGLADVGLEFAATPFVNAGLDISKLPKNYTYDATEDTLTITVDLGNKAFSQKSKTSPQAAFAELLKAYRTSVGYHKELDHYGIDFGDGNMFEWAKDLKTNSLDMVFVLNPEPFILAGVDPSKVEGWAFMKVPVMDAKGNTIQVDKILKPYDISK
ncbi:MAG: hypothetical protein Q8S19_09535 [Bacillota bacterium]|nr:hypothetical protein [Bacillota bacterium]